MIVINKGGSTIKKENEKSPGQLFEENQHLVENTLHRVLLNPKEVARNRGFDYEDLLQYGKMGLWRACTNFDESKSAFQTHAINYIRWGVFDALNFESSLINYGSRPDLEGIERYYIESFDTPDISLQGDEMFSLHDLISSDEIVEERAVDKALFESLMKTLTKREQEIVLMKSEGATNQMVGERFGISGQAVSSAYGKIKAKIKELSEEWQE